MQLEGSQPAGPPSSRQAMQAASQPAGQVAGLLSPGVVTMRPSAMCSCTALVQEGHHGTSAIAKQWHGSGQAGALTRPCFGVGIQHTS